MDFKVADAASVPEVDVGAGMMVRIGVCDGVERDSFCLEVVICLPANAVTSYVDYAFVWFGIQFWRLAHVDLMALICEKSWIRLWRLELGHD